jgi:crotonobetainyl-CoA:carnitine CoA-transferase CaiB-like acyl-CoA transferase
MRRRCDQSRGPAIGEIYGAYQTGDGKWRAIAYTNHHMFERLVKGTMGQPGLLDRFTTMAERLAHRDDLDGLIQAWGGVV